MLLVPLVILSYPVDLLISNNLKKTHSYAGELEVMSDIYNGNAVCDIAIYGSSRAWVQINPHILKDSLGLSAYNFGIDGHNFWLQYLRHLEFLKYNPKPRQIIVAVDVFGLKKRNDLYQLEQFMPFMLWNKNIRHYTSSYAGFEPPDYYIPLIRYLGQETALKKSIAIFRNKNEQYKARDRGYAGMNRKWNEKVEETLNKQRPVQLVLDDASVDLFHRFIRECDESGIEVIMVYTPEYIEGQKKVKNRDEILSIYSTLAEDYGLLYLDYSDHPLCLNKNNFYNAGHLTSAGADIFTSILAHDLKTYSKR